MDSYNEATKEEIKRDLRRFGGFVGKYLTLYWSILGGIIFTIISCMLVSMKLPKYYDWFMYLKNPNFYDKHVTNFIIGFVLTLLIVWGLNKSKEIKRG